MILARFVKQKSLTCHVKWKRRNDQSRSESLSIQINVRLPAGFLQPHSSTISDGGS